jgi:hypothetical protein
MVLASELSRAAGKAHRKRERGHQQYETSQHLVHPFCNKLEGRKYTSEPVDSGEQFVGSGEHFMG